MCASGQIFLGLSIYYVYKYLVKFKRAKSKNTPVQPQEALTGSLLTTPLLCFVKTAEQNKETTSVSLRVQHLQCHKELKGLCLRLKFIEQTSQKSTGIFFFSFNTMRFLPLMLFQYELHC